LLQRCLQPALPAEVYRYVLNFLASQPIPEQPAAFRPTDDMQMRLKYLIEKEKAGYISHQEEKELAEYEHIEHFIVMLKACTNLTSQKESMPETG
jgi:hypothetical protein